MLETVLARLGLPLLVSIVGAALSRIDHPLAQEAAKALGETEEALSKGRITPEQAAEANRHLERMEELKREEFTLVLSEINRSLRAEVASQDPYVRRMRPTFGYIMAITWAAMMLSLAYVILFETEQAHVVINAIQALSPIWAVGLSVLGIYVYKRSEDKRHDPSLFQSHQLND